MAFASIQMFMDKLNHLINSNHIPFFNNPEIICQRPQFQLLYQDLGSMIQTLSIHQHTDLEQLIDLKKRLIYAAEEAEYNVDLFLSDVHVKNNSHYPTSGDFNRSPNRYYFRRSFKSIVGMFISCVHIRNKGHDSPTSGDFKLSLNIDDVRRSFKSIEVEFMSMIKDDGMKAGSSQRPERTLNQSAPAPIPFSRNLLGSKKLIDEIFVGIDRDAELIRDKLVEDQKKLDVVSIVGMGGIGKTTLATKVFNDGFVKYHFHVRVWVTVFQTYDKRAVLTQILESIRGQLDLEKANDSRLRELVHKNLIGERYLIVIDDIWDIETWDDLKLFFPHGNNGSRIMLNTRITEVAKHANSNGLIHHLGYMNKEKSWKLLCQNVFHGNEFPEWSIKPGMKIVESCQGLPLAVVVMAGVLAKEAWSEKFWVKIAEQTGLYVIGDQNECMETLGLSYSHLPLHLKDCFLYLSGFPEDYMFEVQRLIWLWVAEGFIQHDGNRSLEDIAEGYLMDLIDRNLVIVDRLRSNGDVKACKVHDLVRELCLKKAKEERFILNLEKPTLFSELSKVKKPPYRPERMFIDKAFPIPSAQNCRSVLVFGYVRYDDIAKHFRSFVLLRMLHLQECELNDFPKGMELLVHLRYLAIWMTSGSFPSSICNLWNLQTLIYITEQYTINLPSNISDLLNLRHLWGYQLSRSRFEVAKNDFVFPSLTRPMKNLQTITDVRLGEGVDNFQKCFPYIKQLTCITTSNKQNDLKSLSYLEKLNLTSLYRGLEHITFPATLKTLTLYKCGLAWSAMSMIQSLRNLRVLKLHSYSFWGSCWDTDGQEFPQLTFLRLQSLNIKQWEAYSRSFPCLRQLQIIRCKFLEEIPLEIGDIPMLELIKIKSCGQSLGESVRRIEEAQHDFGNYHLKIDISGFWSRLSIDGCSNFAGESVRDRIEEEQHD